MEKIIEKVTRTIHRNGLIQPGEKVIVGVSGGPDSVALLHILLELRHTLGITLHIAHFNHRLRKTALAEENFVRDLAQNLNIPFSTNTKNNLKFRSQGSVEEMARLARFEFLVNTAKEQRTHMIALGHNQDDQAETVLLRILRGTGLCGLRAILPIRKIYGKTFIRPLIEVSRWEIEGFLKSRRLKFRIDPTNQSPTFLRNKIRRELMPLLLKKYNANIKNILSHLASVVAFDYQFIDRST